MNKLKMNKVQSADFASISHRSSVMDKPRHGAGARTSLSRAEIPNVDTRYNSFTYSQLPSRPPYVHSSQSQQSLSQSAWTQSQTTQQLSQNSLEDLGILNDHWRYGPKARDSRNKRPRSPNHAAHTSYLRSNINDGTTNLAVTPASTAQSLLQRIPDRPGPPTKCSLTEVMEQRLIALDNYLNRIFGGLDVLQKDLHNVHTTVKEAALQSDISRQKDALHQNTLQSLVDQLEENRKIFGSLKSLPETMREETMGKLQREDLSKAVKYLATLISEQITNMKIEILESLKPENQVATSRLRPTEPYVDPGIQSTPIPYYANKTSIEEFVPSSTDKADLEIGLSTYSDDTADSTRADLKPTVTRHAVITKLVKRTITDNMNAGKLRTKQEDVSNLKSPRGKRCTGSTIPITSHRMPASKSSSLEDNRSTSPRNDMRKSQRVNRSTSRRINVSDTSTFGTIDSGIQESAWITVRPIPVNKVVPKARWRKWTENPNLNSRRNMPTRSLLEKYSTTETEPIAEIITLEDDSSCSLTYLGTRVPPSGGHLLKSTAETVVPTQDSSDESETRRVRQKLIKTRRRKFLCL